MINAQSPVLPHPLADPNWFGIEASLLLLLPMSDMNIWSTNQRKRVGFD
jgi:hypothetical protein